MFERDLKEVGSLIDISKLSQEQKVVAVNIFNILKSTSVNEKILKTAIELSEDFKPTDINDWYLLAVKSKAAVQEIKKVAYPYYPREFSDIPAQYDLEKWASLVHKIYDAVKKGEMGFLNALDYYADLLDKKSEEDVKFKKWVKYYADGEHKKYSQEKVEMKKESNYQIPLSGYGFYPSETKPATILDQLKDPKIDKSNKEEQAEWKTKLHAAIRRIDKLLRQGDDFLEPDMQEELANLLHSFDLEIRKIRHQVTASDVAFRTANRFKKLGFDPGADVLYKFAQEIPENLAPEEPAPKPAPAKVAPTEKPEPKEKGIPSLPVPENPEEEPSGNKSKVEEVYENTSGPKDGEYEDLSGDIEIADAISKLEEVAARLADRRVIRLLAEFDIMLDKLGIAAMFPELSESQSKLIDSYSYALTRVTKMMGMLSSGKSLSEISEARKKELAGQTMKEVDKTFSAAEEEEQAQKERAADAAKKEPEKAEAPKAAPDKAVPEKTPEKPEATPAPKPEVPLNER